MSLPAEAIQGCSWNRWYLGWAEQKRWSSFDPDEKEGVLGSGSSKSRGTEGEKFSVFL